MKNDPWRWRGIPAVNGEVYGTAVDLDHSAVSASLIVAFAGVSPRWGRSVSRIYQLSAIDSAEGRRQSLAEFKMITASCPDVSTYELAALKPGDKLRQAGTCFSRLL